MGAAPQPPPILAGGAKPPQTPPLNGRSQHLIEAAKRGRLDQMLFFFGDADDTGVADNRPKAEIGKKWLDYELSDIRKKCLD